MLAVWLYGWIYQWNGKVMNTLYWTSSLTGFLQLYMPALPAFSHLLRWLVQFLNNISKKVWTFISMKGYINYMLYKDMLSSHSNNFGIYTQWALYYVFIRLVFSYLLVFCCFSISTLRFYELCAQICSSAYHCCNLWLFALLSPSCQLWLVLPFSSDLFH